MYKRNRDEFNLSYIQFAFYNGVTAPPCYADLVRSQDELVEVDIDHRKKITGV